MKTTHEVVTVKRFVSSTPGLELVASDGVDGFLVRVNEERKRPGDL